MYRECYTRHIYYDETSLNSLTDCVCIVRERKEFSEKKKECLNSLTDCVCIVRRIIAIGAIAYDEVLIALRTVYV